MRNSDTIGNYTKEKELGCGSFGCVYLGRHTYLRDRVAAIKVLDAAHVHSPQECERFFREAQFLNMLAHPYILPLIDFGIDAAGIPYLVTEYAPHGSLRDLLKGSSRHILPVMQAITILTQIGEALHYAHQNNIIHRDLKPENILFTARWQALLADFNIALEQSSANTIHTTVVIGTPPYMAPEQFQGLVCKKSDQYALACIAYELFTGRRPFLGQDYTTLMYSHMHNYPTAPTRLNSSLSPSIEIAIGKAIQKRRINRYPDVLSFIRALQAASLSSAQPSILVHSQRTKQQWLQEGLRLRQLGRYQEALVADEQAIHLDPRYAPAPNNLGNTFFRLAHYEMALAAYERAIWLDTGFALAYHNKPMSRRFTLIPGTHLLLTIWGTLSFASPIMRWHLPLMSEQFGLILALLSPTTTKGMLSNNWAE